MSDDKLVDKSNAYVLFLIRPNGIGNYYRALASLKGYRLDFGYELIDQDWQLDFGGTRYLKNAPTSAFTPPTRQQMPADNRPAEPLWALGGDPAARPGFGAAGSGGGYGSGPGGGSGLGPPGSTGTNPSGPDNGGGTSNGRGSNGKGYAFVPIGKTPTLAFSDGSGVGPYPGGGSPYPGGGGGLYPPGGNPNPGFGPRLFPGAVNGPGGNTYPGGARMAALIPAAAAIRRVCRANPPIPPAAARTSREEVRIPAAG